MKQFTLRFFQGYLFLFFISSSFSFAQVHPTSYDLGKTDNKTALNKNTDSNPSSNSVDDIIITGDTIWVGTGNGVSLSTDRGASWTNFNGIPAFGDNGTSAIGYDKYTSTFWAAKAFSQELNGQSVQTGGGLVYTTDLGKTWTTLPQPVDKENDSLLVYGINDGVGLPKVRALPVIVDEQNVTFDMAFTPGTVWTTSWAGGLRKSTDKGVTWQRVLLPSDKVNSISPSDTIKFSLQVAAGKFGPEAYLNHEGFSVIAVNDSTLYVGTAGGINKSTDNGISWKKFSQANEVNPISGNFVVGLGYDAANNTVWGATWKAEGVTEFYGVSSSSDGGDTWQTFLKDEKVHNFGINPTSPISSSDVIAVSDNGAFRSINKGISWILPGAIIDYQTKTSININIFYSAAAQGADIFLGSADGLAKLTETGGMLWNGRWKVYVASTPLASKTETYAFPNPFSPRLDVLKIKYSTGGSTLPVTIRIFDFGMNYVRTVIQNAQRGNPVHQIDENGNSSGVIDYWDGKDDKGKTVPNGVYFYRVEAGSEDPVYGKILVIQ